MSTYCCARWQSRVSLIRRLGLMAAWAVLANLAPAGAAEAADAPGLTLTKVVAHVLESSPDLAIYPYRARAAEARALQAGLRPNPELSLEIENAAGTGDVSASDAMETTLALSQVIEMGGKRGFREDVGRLKRSVLGRDYQVARLEVLAAATLHFIGVAQTQGLLSLARQAASWAADAADIAERRFDAGSISRAELSQARTDVLRAQLQVSELESRFSNAKLRLASLWGDTKADSFASVQANLFELSANPDFAHIENQLSQSPYLQRYLTLDRLRQAELDLAIARGRQDIQIGAGLTRYEGSGDNGLLLSLSVPLGVSNRNQGGVAAARADLASVAEEQSATRIAIVTQLRTAFEQMQQARRRLNVLRTEILPEAEQALDLFQEGYGRGRFSYLQLVEARRQRLAVESDAIAAAVAFHQTRIILEKLTGEAMTKSTQPAIAPAADANIKTAIPDPGSSPLDELEQ